MNTSLSQSKTGVGYETIRRMAESLATQAKKIRKDIIPQILNKQAEDPQNGLNNLYVYFKNLMNPNLSIDEFADFFAQVATILPLAICILTQRRVTKRSYSSQMIQCESNFLYPVFNYILTSNIPDSLKSIFTKASREVRDAYTISKLFSAYLDETGDTFKTDPFNLFCETFLDRYDPQKKERYGIYFTPAPAVSFIVKSIDTILKEKLDRSDGLGAPNISIIDPALGTASFLSESVKCAAEKMTKKYGDGICESFQNNFIMQTMEGFEIVITNYIFSVLRFDMILKRNRLNPYEISNSTPILKFFLRNTLNIDRSKKQAPGTTCVPGYTHPLKVIVGNPPYSGFSQESTNNTAPQSIEKLVRDYWKINKTRINEKNLKYLKMDYVKFIRFAQWEIDTAGEGLIGFIINHSYLDNLTFRGMRLSLMESFDEIYILNLNVHSMKKESPVDTESNKDRNIFDIQQGVAISFFIKRGIASPAGITSSSGVKVPANMKTGMNIKPACRVYYHEIKGSREEKLAFLTGNTFSTIRWEEIIPMPDLYLFKPDDRLEEAPDRNYKIYREFVKITDIFPVYSVGIVTARDNLTICENPEEMYRTVRDFSKMEEEEARMKYDLGHDTRDWSVKGAQRDIILTAADPNKIVPILFRPFDIRYTYYTGRSRGFLCMPRPEVMKHMLKENLCLITVRQAAAKKFSYCFVSDAIVDGRANTSNMGISYVFPLNLYQDDIEKRNPEYGKNGKPNINPGFLDLLKQKPGYRPIPTAREIFNYVYAVLYSTEYREKYERYLKIDFPAVPVPDDYNLFIRMGNLGERLINIHLMKSEELEEMAVKFEGTGDNVVERFWHENVENEPGKVYINQTQYFIGINSEEWDYVLNGYPVLQKWLKNKRSSKLTPNDIIKYIKIARAVQLTMRLQKEIRNNEDAK